MDQVEAGRSGTEPWCGFPDFYSVFGQTNPEIALSAEDSFPTCPLSKNGLPPLRHHRVTRGREPASRQHPQRQQQEHGPAQPVQGSATQPAQQPEAMAGNPGEPAPPGNGEIYPGRQGQGGPDHQAAKRAGDDRPGGESQGGQGGLHVVISEVVGATKSTRHALAIIRPVYPFPPQNRHWADRIDPLPEMEESHRATNQSHHDKKAQNPGNSLPGRQLMTGRQKNRPIK